MCIQGLDMVEGGNCLGPGTAYGSALIKVGQWEQKLGQNERDFIGSAGMCFTQPLRKFLDTEMKTILKEQGVLEMKRYLFIMRNEVSVKILQFTVVVTNWF